MYVIYFCSYFCYWIDRAKSSLVGLEKRTVVVKTPIPFMKKDVTQPKL